MLVSEERNSRLHDTNLEDQQGLLRAKTDNIDDILERNRNRELNHSTRPNLENRKSSAPETVKVPEAPKDKPERNLKVGKRGPLLLLLVLGIAGVGAVFGIMTMSTTPPIGTNTSSVPSCSSLQFNVIDLKVRDPTWNAQWIANETLTYSQGLPITVTKIEAHYSYTSKSGPVYPDQYDNPIFNNTAFRLTATHSAMIFQNMHPVGYSYDTFNANFTTTLSYTQGNTVIPLLCSYQLHYVLPNGGW